MREILFRAWDDVKNRMYHAGEERDVVFELTGVGIEATDITEGEEEFRTLHHLKYMEYAEIKDKERIELYEHDIVRLESPTGHYRLQAYGMPEKNAHNELFVIVKLSCGFILRHISFLSLKDTEPWDMPNLVHKGWTIIDNYTFWNEQRTFIKVGNIYENPHLLKGDELVNE